MAGDSDKAVLFFSMHDDYSRQVTEMITARGLRSKFMLVSIDNPKYVNNLPPFVDRVPLIYLPRTKQIVVDDVIEKYIISLETEMRQSSFGNEIFAFNEVGGSTSKISDMFSVISDDVNVLGGGNQYYEELDSAYGGGGNRMQMNDVGGGSGGADDYRKNKFDHKQFESYVSQRNNDIQKIEQTRKRA